MEALLRLDDLKGSPIDELEENVHLEIAVMPVGMLKNVFTSFEHCVMNTRVCNVSTLCDRLPFYKVFGMTLHHNESINCGFSGIVFVSAVRGSFCIYAQSKQESHTG